MINDILAVAKDHMEKANDVLIHEFSTVRTGRATGALFDRVMVDAYGSQMPINQMASIKSPDPHSLMIEPWDKTMLKAIEKAILTSDLGLQPNNDGVLIRIAFPALTEERRRELVKQCKGYTEDCKIAVRNVRRDANQKLEKLKKDHEVSEDDVERAEKDVQKLTDDAIAKIDATLKRKEAEIMEV